MTRVRLSYFGRNGDPITEEEWQILVGDLGYKVVDVTEVKDPLSFQQCEVSTTWLGLDHSNVKNGPPVIFETMIFGGPLDGESWRYHTLQQAEIGHRRAVEAVEIVMGLREERR